MFTSSSGPRGQEQLFKVSGAAVATGHVCHFNVSQVTFQQVVSLKTVPEYFTH